MLVSLFVVGSIVFWVLLVVVSLIFLACVHNNVLGGAILTALVTTAGLVLCTDLVHIVLTNPKESLLVVAAYPIIGLLWSFLRWMLFLMDAKEDYLECRYRNMSNTPSQILSKFYSVLHGYEFSIDDDNKLVPPVIGDHLEVAAGWVALWPWSILDSLLGKVLARFCKWLVKRWEKLFDAVSRYWFKDLS